MYKDFIIKSLEQLDLKVTNIYDNYLFLYQLKILTLI